MGDPTVGDPTVGDGKTRVGIELGLIDPPDGYEHPLFKRNKSGSVAHLYDCPRAKTGQAWFWPENEGIASASDLLEALSLMRAFTTLPWIKPCSVCLGDV